MGENNFEATVALSRQLSDQDEKIRNKAINALVAIGETVIPLLIKALRHDVWYARCAACCALQKINCPQTVAHLLSALTDKNSDVRIAARKALEQIGSNAVPELIPALQHEYWRVRWATAKALGNIGNNTEIIIAHLLKKMHDKNTDVRIVAQESVETLGKQNPRVLFSFLHFQDWQIRWAAMKTLAEIRPISLEIIHAIVPLLTDDDEDINNTARQLLITIGEDAVGPLIDIMQQDTPSSHIRSLVQEIWFELGESSLPYLYNALQHRHKYVRRVAIRTVRELESKGAFVLPAIIRLLDHDNGQVRWAAIKAMGKMGSKVLPAMIPILQKLDDSNAQVRKAVEETLQELGDIAAVGLIKILKNQEWPERMLAVKAMGKLGAKAINGIHALVKASEDENSNVRTAAREALLEITDYAVEALKSTGWHTRKSAANTLGQIGSKAITTLPALAHTLQDNNIEVKTAVREALLAIGQNSLPELMEYLNEGDATIRQAVKHTLSAVGDSSIPFLIQALKNSNPEIRTIAIETLQQMGNQAISALPAIANALKDNDWQVKLTAIETIAKMGKMSIIVLTELTETLQDEDWDVAVAGAKALANIGPEASPALPNLIAVLNHWYSDVRDAAIHAIGAIGAKDIQTVKALTVLLQDDEPNVQKSAIEVLGKMGSNAVHALPVLIRLLKAQDREMRKSVLRALLKIGDPAITHLTQSLHSENWETRIEAAYALGKMRGRARSAVSALSVLAKDSDPDIVTTAKKAIRRIHEHTEEFRIKDFKKK